MSNERENQKQSGEYREEQADYGSPRGPEEDGAQFGEQGGGEPAMSKEEWLRQNPDGAFDPNPAPGEGMSKEEWLRQNQGPEQGSGKGEGGRY